MQYFLDCIFRFEIFCYQIVITHEITIFNKPESFLRIAFLFWVEFVNEKRTKRGTISVNVIKLKGKKKETFPQFKGTVEKSTAP